MRMKKKNYLQVYLGELKYKIKKTKISKFKKAEQESKSDTELMAKLESGSDSD